MAQIKEKVPLARAPHSCRERNSSVKNYQLWQQNNKPIEKWSKTRLCASKPWEWKYSSSRNYCDDFEEILKIDVNR
ncbi:hypothetical protein [Elizabethkingia anophelis]|uniref:hypothetical protein n=1 Tax=Elizabethkingia anophelis TaxID=1117645 RepID=UPI0004E37BF3|nr:hypothetical protein [Elizabethkingia anophelis]KFC38476.1 hypothetical protein FF18_17170 [Elizabethkingia anophelis]MCT3785765.1 hypothetical protein [Elizabethkingia anophelis]MCT4325646.1 hypothetical protein [Elizabethkingia anophelis]MDV3500281.1 hypothetical protein [Elizabethkingia anophelis]MDV3953318.1 hypothetical protein [Elizabethkingia anophelis]